MVKEKAFKLAQDLSFRSTIKIKVGAVLYNKQGIIAWGWNNPGNGYGEHAEHMAIRRWLSNYNANDSRGIYIAVYSSRKGRPITSRPCSNCERLLKAYGVKGVYYQRKALSNGRFSISRLDEQYVT